jgi:nucleosome assembly protein 1-like 1
MIRKIDELERKYEKLFESWDKKREEIINGKREPEEAELVLLEEFKTPTKEKGRINVDVEELKANKGFPGFWSKAMQHNPILSPHLKEIDLPILNYVTDIKATKEEGNSYKIIFTFAPNDYFTNTELTKIMIMDKKDDQICKETIGTKIQWKEGKNVTVKTTTKKQKNKSKSIY